MNGGVDFAGEKLVSYAHKFLENRMVTFRKDIERCLMEGCKVEQAYFPALMTCIGFTEFMSGLLAGTLESGNDLGKLEKYSKRTDPIVPPWKVPYDCKVTIGVRALYDDIVRSVAKYLGELKSDRKMQDNFAKCIRKIFPPDAAT